MKVLILAEANSSHTQKWVLGLRDRGLDIVLFSLGSIEGATELVYLGIEVHSINYEGGKGIVSKIMGYTKALAVCRRLVKSVRPDILHAHVVSSYGLLGAFMGFEKFAISVWGSDVYVFPKKSKFSERVVRFALRKAQKVFSSSLDMARETRFYCEKGIDVIPFGVGSAFFEAAQSEPYEILKFATAKSLTPVYNIPIAIEAFIASVEMMPNHKMELHIAGNGSEFQKCVQLAGDMLDKQIFFRGHISHSDMPAFFSDKHVLLNIPDSESFGVSVLEASAAGMAIIATDRGGLPEVVQDGVTGVLIASPGKEILRDAMIDLINNREKIASMGRAGTQFVRSKYLWENSIDVQIRKYDEMMRS